MSGLWSNKSNVDTLSNVGEIKKNWLSRLPYESVGNVFCNL